MKGNNILLTENLQEKTVHGSAAFPIQYYEDMLHTLWNQSIPLHWHREVELLMVFGGSARLQIMDRQIHLADGQGVFVNANVLHGLYMEAGCCECNSPNLVFSSELISAPESAVYQKYVRPIIRNEKYPFVLLRDDTAPGTQILALMRQAFTLFRKWEPEAALPEFAAVESAPAALSGCFELQIQLLIGQVWQLLYENMHDVSESCMEGADAASQIRIQKMLLFVQTHFQEPLSLHQIAASANIGKSEANRCFQKYLRTSPVEYLLEYRMAQAARMLDSPHMSVGEIGQVCGFQDPGYFSKMFRKRTGLSPREYRKKKKDSIPFF